MTSRRKSREMQVSVQKETAPKPIKRSREEALCCVGRSAQRGSGASAVGVKVYELPLCLTLTLRVSTEKGSDLNEHLDPMTI